MEYRYVETTQTRLIEKDGQQYIEGHGTIFGNTYFVPQEGIYERIDSKAFNESIASGQVVESCYNHDPNHILATSEDGQLQVWNDGSGLRYRIKFDPSDPDHQKVKRKIEKNLIKGSSIRFLPSAISWAKEDGKPVATIRAGKLFELGPVNNPCNPEALAAVRHTDGQSTLKESFKAWEETQKRKEFLKGLNSN